MNRKFWENLGSLCGVHVLNYIMPLLTLPFLARMLGPVHWGQLAFAEAYAVYVSVFIEYGFGLSATREVAQVRDQVPERSRILTGVLAAQVLLSAGALIVTLCLGYAAKPFAPYQSLLPIAFCLAVFRAINPLWYFQALEQMRLVALVTVLANVAAAVGMLVLVRSPRDYWIPLVLRAGAALVSLTFNLIVAYRSARFSMPALADALSLLRQGWSLFLFKGAVSLYTSANVVVLGMLASPSVVAAFAGGEKIANAAAGAITPISQAFYPRITYLLANNREDATRTARVSLLMTLSAGLGLGLTLLIGAPWLVHFLLGARFADAIPVLRFLSVLPPTIAASNVLGIQWMLPLRLDKQFNWIIVTAGLANIILAWALVPRYGQMGMAVSVGLAESLVALAIIVVLRRNQLDPWRRNTPTQMEATAV